MKLTTTVLAVLLLAGPVEAVAEQVGLPVGARVQNFTFTDIQGVAGSLDRYKDWIQVFTFADRGSSDPLMEWMSPAGMEAIRRHPAVQFARINFADVTAVPGMFENMVGRILRRIDADATAELIANYDAADMEFRPDLNVFHMIPDWDGAHLKRFGLEDAGQWHAWIAVEGVITAHIVQSDADPGQRFIEAIGEAVRKRQSGSIQ